MKVLILSILMITLGSWFSPDSPDAIIGSWDADKAKVEIYKDGNSYIGNPVDANGKRNEKVRMLDLKYQDEMWVGKIYAPKKKKYFDVECKVEGEKLLLEVDAGLVSKTVEWARIEN